MRSLLLLGALLLSGQAVAADETDFGPQPVTNVKSSVSYDKETYNQHDGNSTTDVYYWTVRSGDVGASVDNTSRNFRGDLYTTVGRVTTLGNKYPVLNKLQLEAHAASNGVAYGLLGTEVPVPSLPVAVFVAGVANNKDYRSVIGGPELYWQNSVSRLTVYPSQANYTDSNVRSEGAVTLRNTIKEFGPNASAEVDGLYKRVTDKGQFKEGFGFALGLNIWRLGLSIEQTPFWETSDYDRTQLQATWNYQM